MKYGFILAIVCLVACASKDKEAKTSPQIKKEGIEKEVKKLPEKVPIKEILLSESGVGRLGAKSTFDLDTVQAAFGGYTVIQSEGSMEGQTYKIFLVKKKEAVILEISSDEAGKKVTEILARSATINNEVGARVGATFKSIFPKKENANCMLGVDDLGDTYMCDIPRIRNVRYRFQTTKKGEYTPDGDWILTSIEWRPLPSRQ